LKRLQQQEAADNDAIAQQSKEEDDTLHSTPDSNSDLIKSPKKEEL